MLSINGIGTSLYGKNDLKSDGSYVATKWIIFLFLPLVPLHSYRVQRKETESMITALIGMPGSETKYEFYPIPLNWKQIGQTYLFAYGIIALLVLDFMFDPYLLFGPVLLVAMCIYGLYYLFKTGKKWWAVFLIFFILAAGFSILVI